MNPIIYNTRLHKSLGIYKGAGGIYNGRGIYNGSKKINKPVFPYVMDINAFDPLTLKDGEVQYQIQGGGYGPITLFSDRIRFGRNVRLELPLTQFSNIPNKLKIEIVVNFTLSDFNFVGITLAGLQIGSGGWWTNAGLYFIDRDLSARNIYQGYSSGSWDIFQRFAGIPFIQPMKITVILDFVNRSLDIYFNDLYVANLVYASNYYWTTNNNIFGVYPENNPGSWIDVYSYKAYEIT